MNRALWIAEIAGQFPCGDNLEYAPEFLAIGQAVQGRPEQQYGETIIPAEEPDWSEVERLAEELLSRTKDLRVCVLLTRACTNNHGLAGLAAGLQTIHALLERYWDAVHPCLVIDDDPDPFIRINAIAALADKTGLVHDVRQAVLIKSSVGPISVKNAEAALSSNQLYESAFSREQLIAMCLDAQTAGQLELAAITEAEHAVNCIAQLCEERFGAQHAPDISPLSNILSLLVRNLVPRGPSDKRISSGTADDAVNVDTDRDSRQIQNAHAVLDLRSREDAIQMLETVCRYIEKNEPTNPAPLLIKRAQRLMSLNFIDIIKELAPDSMGQIGVITGIRGD